VGDVSGCCIAPRGRWMLELRPVSGQPIEEVELAPVDLLPALALKSA
jgi:hypothetical protein